MSITQTEARAPCSAAALIPQPGFKEATVVAVPSPFAILCVVRLGESALNNDGTTCCGGPDWSGNRVPSSAFALVRRAVAGAEPLRDAQHRYGLHCANDFCVARRKYIMNMQRRHRHPHELRSEMGSKYWFNCIAAIRQQAMLVAGIRYG
eukprot:1173210-Pleurochrysis_carterae.AAC.3